MTESSKKRWWIVPVVTLAIVAAIVVVALLVPQANTPIRIAGNVLKSEEPTAIRIFVVTWGHRSPLALIAMLAWAGLVFPLPEIGALRASGLLFGPFLGSLVNWIGLVAGASLLFAIGRGLLGSVIARVYPRKDPPLGIARWVVLGLRLVPFVPQDIVSLAAGVTRVPFLEFLIPTAIGLLPIAVVYAVFPEQVPPVLAAALTWTSTIAGVGLLSWLAWKYRSRIPYGTLSDQRKRTLAVGAVVVAAGVAAYLLLPTFKASIDSAVSLIASGDISAVRDYLLGFGVWAPLVSASLMILQSLAAPLPAFVITFSNGLLFGWAWGALLSWSSAMAGAALCFFLARSLGRPAVEKLVGGSTALRISDRFFDRFGERAVLIARLLPFVSFDIISYGAGLTSMGFWPFFIATGIGQLPATLVYSYLGQNMTSSVRIVFFTFVIFTALLVAIAAMRPLFQAWLEREREAGANA